MTVESVAAAIACYDPNEASALSASLRPVIDLEPQLDAFEALYADVIADFRSAPVSIDDLVAALGPVLHRLLPRYPGADWPWQLERADLLARVAELDATLARERGDAIRLLGSVSHGADDDGKVRPRSADLAAARSALHPRRRRGLAAVARVRPAARLARAPCDDLSDPRRSPLRLFEDGKPLGPAHALHQRIREDGAGRYLALERQRAHLLNVGQFGPE